MRPLDSLVSYQAASSMVAEAIQPVERTETLAVDDASGRVLAKDVAATHSTPPFDRASMDGYAVIASDLGNVAPSRTLTIIEEVFAGSVPQKKLAPGQAIQIATGARLPQGADTVVMVEDTRRDGNLVQIFKSPSRGSNITLLGSDIKEGEVVLKKDTLLDPARIGVLASQGLSEVTVYVKPIIAVMPTGSEIVATGQTLKPGQIYDINSHTLASVVRRNGGEPRVLPITRDDMPSLKASLQKALAEADMVVTSGGSSVGERDFLAELFAEMGEVKFHGVRLKPGKPSAFALIGGKPVLGMPGYPTSCLMNAYLLLAPAVRRLARLPAKQSNTVMVTLGETLRGAVGRMMFLPVKLEEDKAYNAFKDSGAITSMAGADGYIVVPQDAELNEGASVSLTLF